MKSPEETIQVALEEGVREALRSPARLPTSIPAWAFNLADLLLAAADAGGRERIAAALADGVRQTASRIDEVAIVATGLEWLGGGVAAVVRTMLELIAGAEREVILTAYSMTPGSDRIWTELERVLTSGVRCTLVVDHLQDQHPDMRSLLERLANRFPDVLHVYDFVDVDDNGGLHAKILVVDRTTALVGSANLSHRGMVTAHELAVVVRGPTGELIAGQVDRLLRSACVKRFP